MDEVRALHAPSGDSWLCCEGCDMDGWEAEAPEWPCRTARLVYSAAEIESFKAQEKACRAALMEANRQRKEQRKVERANGSPATLAEQIADLYEPLIRQSLAAPSIFRLP